MEEAPLFRYLNLDNAWPLVPASQRVGLEIGEHGELTLARLPLVEAAATDPLPPAPGLQGPAGIGIDEEGNLYVADPANHRVLRVDACDGSTAPFGCLHGPGSEPGQLNGPRGVRVGPRNALYVADSGNHRVQVADLRTGQLRGIWGQPDVWAEPTASADPGGFYLPWDLAVDAAGSVYVTDPGIGDLTGAWHSGRVQRFDADGRVDPAFWTAMQAGPQPPGAPASVAVVLLDSAEPAAERLLVLDRQPPRLLLYKLDGSYDAVGTTRWQQVNALISEPVGAVASDGRLYVADAAHGGRLLVFDRNGIFIGITEGVDGPVAGLTLDRHGRLLLHPGGGATVQSLSATGTAVPCGTFLAGPIQTGAGTARWHRLQAMRGPLPSAGHVQLFTATSEKWDGSPGRRPQLPITCDAGFQLTVVAADDPVTAELDTWRAAPRDALDVLVLNAPGRYLWLAGRLEADGAAPPRLDQVRVEFDHVGWMPYLPAIYGRDPIGRRFPERALALFESVLQEAHMEIDDLPRLFDPQAAPDEDPSPSWLDWLASWLAFDLDERWTAERRRDAVTRAFAVQAWRGTREGLQQLVALYSGTTPRISEPAGGVWALDGEHSVLGIGTRLAVADAQGAVLNTTATLSQTHLIADAEYGAPVFEPLANRFCVELYAAHLSDPGVLDRLRQIVDREKPAHTDYHICAIDPRFRVGLQARTGIDAIVGGQPNGSLLDGRRHLGLDSTLPSTTARPEGGAVGRDARVGMQAKRA